MSDEWTPEQKLWEAVILQTLADAAVMIKKIKYSHQKHGVVSIRVRGDLDALKRTIKSEHYYFICDAVGIHPDHIHNEVEKMEIREMIHRIRFLDDSQYKKIASYKQPRKKKRLQ